MTSTQVLSTQYQEKLIIRNMVEMIEKRLYQTNTLSYLVLLFSVFIISCNGQNKTNVQQNSTIESNTIPIDSTKKRNQPNNREYGIPFLTPNSNEQISRVVRKIFQDKKGNLWFGNEGGAYRYDGTSLYHLDAIEKQIGQGVTIKDIAEDKDGNIWFGHGSGISKFDGESITNYSEKDGLINNDVWSMSIDQNGIVWIGTLQGVCYFNQEKFTPFAIPEAKPDSTRGVTSAKIVHSIMEDSKGRMWFGTNGGAYVYDGKSLSNISEKDGLCNNNVNSILEDKNGNMWFATTHNGLCRFDGKSFTNISEQNGLKGKEIGDVYQDHLDNIWFTAKGFGVYRYDGKSFANFNEKDGLQSHVIMSIFQDKEERLWFGGLNGLSHYDGKSFINVSKGGPWTK